MIDDNVVVAVARSAFNSGVEEFHRVASRCGASDAAFDLVQCMTAALLLSATNHDDRRLRVALLRAASEVTAGALAAAEREVAS